VNQILSRDGEKSVWRTGVPRIIALVGCAVVGMSLHGLATAKVSDSHGADTTYPRSIDRVPQTGMVEVAIIARDQSGLAAWNKSTSAARRASGFDVARNGLTAGRRVAIAQERGRERSIRRLNTSATDEVAKTQARLTGLVKRLGGRVSYALPMPSMVFAELPGDAIEDLRRSPLVQAVEPVADRNYLGVAEISGADTWHTAGCTGAGASDACPNTSSPSVETGPTDATSGQGGPDVAVDDQSISDHHWAFTGGPTPSLGRSPAIVQPAGRPDINGSAPGNTNGSLHGNTIASVIATKQPDRRGVAYGVDKILDPVAPAIAANLWLLGLPFNGNPGTTDLPESWNKSYGFFGVAYHGVDDIVSDQQADMEASQYGIGQAISAGNDGPYSSFGGTVRPYDSPGDADQQARTTHPCVAFNAICTGAVWGTVDYDPANDFVTEFSSRGPTVGGRKKPDLVAHVGSSWGCPFGGYVTYDSDYDDFSYDAFHGWRYPSICGVGTSYAAPFVAGGQLLLSGVGVTSPMAQKAILINSAFSIDSEQDTDSAAQEYWTPDVGWGELDLDVAYQQRGKWRLGTTEGMPYNNAAFFRVNGQSAGDRTTLVWHRRAIVDDPSTLTTLAFTTTDLDLYQLSLAGADNDKDVCGASTSCGVDLSEDSDTGVKLVQPVPGPTGLVPVTGTTGPSGIVTKWDAQDTSTDTVEQVRANTGGDSIIKVKASSTVDGANSEDFAIASTQPLIPLATPTIDAPAPDLSDSVTSSGQSITVEADFNNQSSGADLVQGLDLHNAQVTINLPAGVDLVSGAATQGVGTLVAGETDQGSWTVQSTNSGAHPITFTAQGSRFGTTFSSTSQPTILTADSEAPTVQVTAPSGWQGQRTNPVGWVIADTLTGVASVEVDASIDYGPFQPVYIGSNAEGNAHISAPEGASVTTRVRATDGQGNQSDYETATWQVDGDPPTLTLTTPPPVLYGESAIVTVSALNNGSPMATSFRLGQDPATPFTPLLSQSVTLPAVNVQAFVEVRATDGLGRTVAQSAMVESVPHPTRLDARIRRSGRRSRIEMRVSRPADGYVSVRVKCRRRTRRSNVIIRKGRGRMILRRGLGNCFISGEFRPIDKHRYSKSRVKLRAKL
jgi:hypothetical protein